MSRNSTTKGAAAPKTGELDLGAQVGQHLPGPRTGQDAGKLDDLQPGQRRHGRPQFDAGCEVAASFSSILAFS